MSGRWIRSVSVLVVCTWFLTGCASGTGAASAGPRSPSSSTPSTPGTSGTSVSSFAAGLPAYDDLSRYFTAIATQDAAGLRRALPLTQPGSPAHAYTVYALAAAQAAVDGGEAVPGPTPRAVAGGFEACPTGGPCVTWDDLAGHGGRIATFEADGHPIGSRVAVGTGSGSPAGSLASVRFRAAYQSVQSGYLFVVADVTSRSEPLTLALYGASYRIGSRAPVAAAEALGRTQLAPRTTTTVDLVFPASRIGGVATMSLSGPRGRDARDVRIATR